MSQDLFTWASQSIEKKRQHLAKVQFGSRAKQRERREATTAALKGAIASDVLRQEVGR